MNKNAKIFLILCIALIAFVIIMFIPDSDPKEDGTQTEIGIRQENADETIKNDDILNTSPSRIEEWDAEEFVEDKETEILGTFARKSGAATVFIYFDREGILLRETHEGDYVEKELGRYKLTGSVLNIDGEEHDFKRDGDDIVIDGKVWEYLEGVILSAI